ncbi:serine/arginine-rich splicing factor SR45-like isoform X2 [Papaver somniferum]|uniref:serine/arginine-rich splicing factor SR45-like isoform X2 n=1 Tax=Papaver somniferum TaxID=3469 RepID=UPI000E6F8F88|nr:serine/arginine-rich splicing factor SR45-like isoform X2 [Papaver somniferum]
MLTSIIGMSTGSSDQSSEEMSDLHKDEGSAHVKKLDLNPLESKQEGEVYDHRSQVELNQEEEEEDGQISSPPDVRYDEERKANGNGIETLQSFEGETQVVNNKLSRESNSPMVEDTLGSGAGIGNVRDEESNKNSGKTELAFNEVVDGGSEFIERDRYNNCETKKDASYYSSKSPQNSDRLEGRMRSPSAQQTAGRRLSSSPKGVRELSHAPGSPRRRPSDSPTKRNSTSPGRRTRQDLKRKDDPDRKRHVASPRKHYSPPDRKRKERLASRSPTRRRESTSGYRRDNRDRSRSRSPYARDRHQISPRRRYSPRRRSPPGSHSRHRSPRRRPWSPPPNRNTGIGKPGKNLFVAGFSFVTTEKDLERKFSRFGRVRDVRIVRDKRSGDSRGFGFLSLERDEDADAAIRALDQTQWNGRVVLVEKSKAPAS